MTMPEGECEVYMDGDLPRCSVHEERIEKHPCSPAMVLCRVAADALRERVESAVHGIGVLRDALRAKVEEVEKAYYELLATRDAQVAAYSKEIEHLVARSFDLGCVLLTAQQKISTLDAQVGAMREALENVRNCAKGIMPIHSGKPDGDLMKVIIGLNDARWTRLFAIYAEADAALASGGREKSTGPGPACPRCGLFLAVPDDCPFCSSLGREKEKP